MKYILLYLKYLSNIETPQNCAYVQYLGNVLTFLKYHIYPSY